MTRDKLAQMATAALDELGVPESNRMVQAKRGGVDVVLVSQNCNRQTVQLLTGDAKLSAASVKLKLANAWEG